MPSFLGTIRPFRRVLLSHQIMVAIVLRYWRLSPPFSSCVSCAVKNNRSCMQSANYRQPPTERTPSPPLRFASSLNYKPLYFDILFYIFTLLHIYERWKAGKPFKKRSSLSILNGVLLLSFPALKLPFPFVIEHIPTPILMSGQPRHLSY